MTRVTHRGYTAQEYAGRMSIRDWNGDVVYSKMHWKGSSCPSETRKMLCGEVDRFITLAPYKGLSWWSA